jgi:hypothetical protein
MFQFQLIIFVVFVYETLLPQILPFLYEESFYIFERTYFVVVAELSFLIINFFINALFQFSRVMSHLCYGLYWKSYRC